MVTPLPCTSPSKEHVWDKWFPILVDITIVNSRFYAHRECTLCAAVEYQSGRVSVREIAEESMTITHDCKLHGHTWGSWWPVVSTSVDPNTGIYYSYKRQCAAEGCKTIQQATGLTAVGEVYTMENGIV
jgi:hypothetical protein